MGIQFLKQSSASSLGCALKMAKDTADPSLCCPGILMGYGGGWTMAATVVLDSATPRSICEGGKHGSCSMCSQLWMALR